MIIRANNFLQVDKDNIDYAKLWEVDFNSEGKYMGEMGIDFSRYYSAINPALDRQGP